MAKFICPLFYCLLLQLTHTPSSMAQEDTNKSVISKAKITIMEPVPPASGNSSFNSGELLAALETALHATRRFDVVSRDKKKLKSIRDEQKFSASEFSKGNAAETGELDAAHFIVFPTVTEFSFGRSARPVPNIDNKYFINDSGSLGLNIQVVDSTTGEINGNFPVKSSFGTKGGIANSRGGGPAKSNYSKLCKEVSDKFASQLINTIYPTRILKITGKEVWINRGENSGITKGSQYKVYRPGETLIDPDTGENLGSTEKEIGTIKIIKINPKVSVGEALSDEILGNIKEGDIVRP